MAQSWGHGSCNTRSFAWISQTPGRIESLQQYFLKISIFLSNSLYSQTWIPQAFSPKPQPPHCPELLSCASGYALVLLPSSLFPLTPSLTASTLLCKFNLIQFCFPFSYSSHLSFQALSLPLLSTPESRRIDLIWQSCLYPSRGSHRERKVAVCTNQSLLQLPREQKS